MMDLWNFHTLKKRLRLQSTTLESDEDVYVTIGIDQIKSIACIIFALSTTNSYLFSTKPLFPKISSANSDTSMLFKIVHIIHDRHDNNKYFVNQLFFEKKINKSLTIGELLFILHL